MTRRRSLLMVLAVAGMVLAPGSVAAGGGCHPGPGVKMTSSSSKLVGIGGCAFRDTVTYVEPGDTVEWVNKDFVPHTVTGAALSWGDEKFLDKGDRVSYTFDEAGVFPYYCALHPTMVGAVVVGDGMNTMALGAGAAPVEKIEDAAPVSSTESAPIDTNDGLSPAVVALAVAAALGAGVIATRYALARRARTAPTV
jgi:plastocyanin